MKRTLYLAIVVAAGVMLVGCTGGGSEDDPSKACFDYCDRYDDCNIDIFSGRLCNSFCGEIDDLENFMSEDCELAVADLFNCGESQSCEELTENIDPRDIDDARDLLEAIFSDCEDEARDVAVDCDGDLPD
jgi:hypothetical protein